MQRKNPIEEFRATKHVRKFSSSYKQYKCQLHSPTYRYNYNQEWTKMPKFFSIINITVATTTITQAATIIVHFAFLTHIRCWTRCAVQWKFWDCRKESYKIVKMYIRFHYIIGETLKCSILLKIFFTYSWNPSFESPYIFFQAL